MWVIHVIELVRHRRRGVYSIALRSHCTRWPAPGAHDDVDNAVAGSGPIRPVSGNHDSHPHTSDPQTLKNKLIG